LRTIPIGPKPDHVREIIDKLGVVGAVGIAHDAADRIHPDRFRRLVREGLSPALLIDLEARLTDAAIEMADRLIGAAFTRGKKAQERQYNATARTSPG
jgi:hypothetical protein